VWGVKKHKILVRKPEGDSPFCKFRLGLDGNLEIDLKAFCEHDPDSVKAYDS
jgi:hypothetical protein